MRLNEERTTPMMPFVAAAVIAGAVMLIILIGMFPPAGDEHATCRDDEPCWLLP